MLDKKIVGKNIASYRKRKEISQKELAELLNITAQSVSKWEAGVSLPTVDMLYDVAGILDVSIDSLLSDKVLESRDICYMDTGLDTTKLYTLKDEIEMLATKDKNLLYSHYVEPVVFKMDLEQMEEPIFALTTNVPGSKARLARERGCDKEICADLAARAINNVLRFGMMPQILQAHVVCGSKDNTQLREMAESFKEICESNNVIFSGMEISCQPINFRADEYEVSVGLVAAADKKDIITGKNVQEGDAVIAIMTEGLEASSYPFVRVILDRKPELAYEKIDSNHYFTEELLKPGSTYTFAIRDLQKEKLLHGVSIINNSFLNEWLYQRVMSDKLGVCINLSAIPIKPLYRFMQGLDMVGKKYFPHRFNMGIGMIVIVPKLYVDRAMEIIGRYNECHIVGRVEKNDTHDGRIVWTEGKLKW